MVVTRNSCTFDSSNKNKKIMKTLKDLNLTELEKSFVENLIPELYAEPGFTDVEVKEVAEKMGIDVKSAKGVLGSLCKKGILSTQLHDPSELKRVGKRLKLVIVKYEFIILNENYYYLHPEWK